MAYQKYRFTLKSEELRGAGTPNIVYMLLNSDADAAIFADNLEKVFDANVVTVDVEIATNYALPYPQGTNREFRMVFRDGSFIVQTERIYNVLPNVSTDTFSASLVAAANYLILPKASGGVVTPGGQITSCNIAVFNPTQSV